MQAGKYGKGSAIYLALDQVARLQGFRLQAKQEPVTPGARQLVLTGLLISDDILPETIAFYKRDAFTIGAVRQLQVISGVLSPVLDATAHAAFCAPLVTRLGAIAAEYRRLHP